MWLSGGVAGLLLVVAAFVCCAAAVARGEGAGGEGYVMMPPQIARSVYPEHRPPASGGAPFWQPHARVLRSNEGNAPSDFNPKTGALVDGFGDGVADHDSNYDFWMRVGGVDRATGAVVNKRHASTFWLVMIYSEGCGAALQLSPVFREIARRVKAYEASGEPLLEMATEPGHSLGPVPSRARKLLEARSAKDWTREMEVKLQEHGLQLGVVNMTRDPLVAKAFGVTPFGDAALPYLFLKRGDTGQIYRYVVPGTFLASKIEEWIRVGHLLEGEDTERIGPLPPFPLQRGMPRSAGPGLVGALTNAAETISEATASAPELVGIPVVDQAVAALPAVIALLERTIHNHPIIAGSAAFAYGLLVAAYARRMT